MVFLCFLLFFCVLFVVSSWWFSLLMFDAAVFDQLSVIGEVFLDGVLVVFFNCWHLTIYLCYAGFSHFFLCSQGCGIDDLDDVCIDRLRTRT